MPAASGAKKNSSASNAGRSYSKTKRAFLVKALFCVLYKLESNDVIDAVASSEVHGVGAYAPWSRTCVASSPQLNFSPAFPGKSQRHLWFFEIAYDDLRPDLHIDS